MYAVVPHTREEANQAKLRKESNAAEILKAHGETIRHALNQLDTEEARATRKALNLYNYHS